MMPHKPLLLKDYLELDVDSCDTVVVLPPATATVRGLISTDRHPLTRSKSKIALTKLSSIIKFFSSSPPTAPNCLPRSFSKRLGQGFWKKRAAELQAEDKRLRVRVRDIVRWTSFQEADIAELRRRDRYLTAAPVVSSSSSGSSENGDGESDFHLSSCASSVVSVEHDDGAAAAAAAGGGGGGESHRETATCRRDSENDDDKDHKIEVQSEEEKEQLSPVSVMDFPDEEVEEEEEDNNSPCFKQTLAKIERTRQQLLQKLRRFESLAQLDLDPINLDQCFASSEDDQLEATTHVDSDMDNDVDTNSASSDPARSLLNKFKANVSCDSQFSASVEKLLLKFFGEGLSIDCTKQARKVSTEEELLNEAKEWLFNRGPVDVFGTGQLKEIERNGDWIKFEEGVDEVAADVETGMMRWLLDELVLDLVSC